MFEIHLLELNKTKKQEKEKKEEFNDPHSLNARIVTLENLMLRKKHLYNQKMDKLEQENVKLKHFIQQMQKDESFYTKRSKKNPIKKKPSEPVKTFSISRNKDERLLLNMKPLIEKSIKKI